MAKPIIVPGVPKGFTGRIVEIVPTENPYAPGAPPMAFIRIVARNRQIVAVTQLYSTVAHARRAARALARHMVSPVTIVDATRGRP